MLDQKYNIQIVEQAGEKKQLFQLVVPRLRLTVRELIRLKVHQEFTTVMFEYEKLSKLADPATNTPITGANHQFIWISWMHKIASTSNWEEEVEKACAAFTAGSYVIIAQGHQLENIDDEIILEQDAEIKFIRLIPLVGG